MVHGRLVGREPIGITATHTLASYGVHVLDDSGEAHERPGWRAANWRLDVVRDKNGRICLLGHFVSSEPLDDKYQSRSFSPFQATTPSWARISAKVFCT